MKQSALKSILAIAIALAVTGCSREVKEMTGEFQLPPELSHCSIHKMNNTGLNSVYLYVVNCPNSTTTTTNRTKNPTRVVVNNPPPDTTYVETEDFKNVEQKLIPRPMTPEEYSEYYKKNYRH